MLTIFYTLIFTMLSSGFAPNTNDFNTNQATSKLSIQINDVKQDDGVVLVSFYSDPSQFPYKPFRVESIEKSNLQGNVLNYSIDDLKPGKYAITLLDDADRNGDMEYNMFGIPKEGYGFSNDAKPRGLSAPNFDDCSFVIEEEGELNISIKMKYW